MSLIRRTNRGFTLVELAIVLIIVALLSGGLMMTVSAQMDRIAMADTQRRLDEARDALLGFAAANGRLPCPAVGGTTGVEAPLGGGTCNSNWDGFLPAITLGIGPTNANGYALDGWGNPIRYALTAYTNGLYCPGHVFGTANCIRTAWNNGASMSNVPDLRVCNTVTGMTGAGVTASCATGTELTNNAVVVIFSRGKNGASPPVSSDEATNGDPDRVFVSHTPTPAGANEFDDLLTWISPNILYNRMIAAGRLP